MSIDTCKACSNPNICVARGRCVTFFQERGAEIVRNAGMPIALGGGSGMTTAEEARKSLLDLDFTRAEERAMAHAAPNQNPFDFAYTGTGSDYPYDYDNLSDPDGFLVPPVDPAVIASLVLPADGEKGYVAVTTPMLDGDYVSFEGNPQLYRATLECEAAGSFIFSLVPVQRFSLVGFLLRNWGALAGSFFIVGFGLWLLLR